MYHHSGDYIQRGRGIGSFFKALLRGFAPVLKSIIKSPVTKKIVTAAKDNAIEAGLNIASDALQGKSIGESIESNVLSAADKVVGKAREAVSGRKKPNKRKKKASLPPPPVVSKKSKHAKKAGKGKKGRSVFD
jgi:hypothetical protein